ncbi:MAG: QueT transporter family protein [Clostridia bacterium]|nr:QueT transporter family protein [Clostridia bacterium]
MTRKTKNLTQASVLAALYVVLTYAQNIIWPGSASLAIQLRLSEALNIFAFFTPAAIPGLAAGCLLFNLSYAGALPFDWLVGTLATLLAGLSMYKLRQRPWLGLVMPALFNAPLVGWELAAFLGEGGFAWPLFGANALNVFLGEAMVMYTAGWALYGAFKRRNLHKQFF